tara:strand:+ start:377 stop:766 length:390 start_codon:yes stop_codon:yes gene_type:complete
MPVLEMHLAVIGPDGSLSLFQDHLITGRHMDHIDAITYYKDINPDVEVLASRWMLVSELAPQLPSFLAPVAPPPAPAPKPKPTRPFWQQIIVNAWPLTLALGGLIVLNAVASIEHVNAGIQRSQLEAQR